MSDHDNDVLNLPRPKWDHHEIAILGGSQEDDLAMAGNYASAAEILALHWIEKGPDDGLPLPILYLYRHSLELALKWLIRVAARCAVRDGYAGQENLSPARVDERLRDLGHNLKDLADCLDRYMKLLKRFGPNNSVDRDSQKLLRKLSSADEWGDAFRYAVIGKAPNSAPARPTQESRNFYEEVNELHKLAILLTHGYSTELYNYEEMQTSGF
ncbi:hypothetical protein OIA45_19770 [Streptomyces chartreusis]|uniref:hypothetical protein n=1 Tax=Streptomyces chartreusis TaxID=1969 RepID=UPI00386A7945|nr:hypothetical protein OIA45_19770 [Streptomyces chartreusis]